MESNLNNQWRNSYVKLKKEFKINEDKLVKFLQTPVQSKKVFDNKSDMDQLNKITIYQQYVENDKNIGKYMNSKIRVIKSFRSNLNDIQKMLRQTTDTGNLQLALERFEQQLSKWKLSISTDLRDDEEQETILTSSLNDFETVMQQWEQQDHTTYAGDSANNNLEREAQQQRVTEHTNQILAYKAQVGTVERKLAALGGGRTGGWDSRDHDIFLRIYTQCCPDNNINNNNNNGSTIAELSATALRNLMKKMKPMLPGCSEGDIASHLSWYREMLALLSEKKELLRKWQHEKVTSEGLQLIPDGASLPSEADALSKAGSRSSSQGKVDRVAVKANLEQWRLEKVQKEQDEMLRLEEEAVRKRLFDKEQQLYRQQVNKVKLQQWEEERKQQQQEQPPEEEDMRGLSEEQIIQMKRRQQQNIDAAKAKHQQLLERQKEHDRERIIKAVWLESDHSALEGVSSKLLSATKASEANRVSALDLDGAESSRRTQGAHGARVAGSGYDLKFTGRAVPAWCKNGAIR